MVLISKRNELMPTPTRAEDKKAWILQTQQVVHFDGKTRYGGWNAPLQEEERSGGTEKEEDDSSFVICICLKQRLPESDRQPIPWRRHIRDWFQPHV